MAKCRVCDGEGRLLQSVCPLCDGVIGWPEAETGFVMSSDPLATFARGPMLLDGFSVLCWNIFNPETVGVATRSNPHYNHLTDEERFWEHRWPKILDEIRIADAMVVCLQEISKGLFVEIKDALSALGYEVATHKKMQRNSLAIFFKETIPKVWEATVRIKGFEKTLAVGLKYGGRTIAVVTCHLEGHPEKSLERLEQLEKTFGEIQKLPHDAVVVAGDFNAPLAEDGRNTAVSSYMSCGEVVAGSREWGREILATDGTLRHHGYELSSAYVAGPAVSIALHGEGPSLIDQIWFSRDLEIVGVRDVFFDQHFRAEALMRGLPNERNPSDHLPLGAVLRWR